MQRKTHRFTFDAVQADWTLQTSTNHGAIIWSAAERRYNRSHELWPLIHDDSQIITNDNKSSFNSILYSLSNISAKKYQNWLMCGMLASARRCTYSVHHKCRVLRHTVEYSLSAIVQHFPLLHFQRPLSYYNAVRVTGSHLQFVHLRTDVLA